MLEGPKSLFEWLREGGLLAVCVGLVWLLWKMLDRVFSGYERRLEDRDKLIAILTSDRDTARKEAQEARAQVLEGEGRFHRAVTRLEPTIREQVQWIAFLARRFGGGGGGDVPPTSGRGDPALEEDAGGDPKAGRR